MNQTLMTRTVPKSWNTKEKERKEKGLSEDRIEKWTEIVQLLENPLSGTVEQDNSGL
jgi:hypothetical protein